MLSVPIDYKFPQARGNSVCFRIFIKLKKTQQVLVNCLVAGKQDLGFPAALGNVGSVGGKRGGVESIPYQPLKYFPTLSSPLSSILFRVERSISRAQKCKPLLYSCSRAHQAACRRLYLAPFLMSWSAPAIAVAAYNVCWWWEDKGKQTQDWRRAKTSSNLPTCISDLGPRGSSASN